MKANILCTLWTACLVTGCGQVVEAVDRGEVCVRDGTLQVQMMRAICVSPDCGEWLDVSCSATVDDDVLVVSTYASARQRLRGRECVDICLQQTAECDLPEGAFSTIELGGETVENTCQ